MPRGRLGYNTISVSVFLWVPAQTAALAKNQYYARRLSCTDMMACAANIWRHVTMESIIGGERKQKLEHSREPLVRADYVYSFCAFDVIPGVKG